jgi:hypothetical protein
MYAALSQNRKQAKLRYSEYCTRAPQRRYLDGTQMRKQMYKIHLPHVKSSYLSDVEYRNVTDESGQPDWEILYVPGKKARAEFYAFTKNVRAGIKSWGEEVPALPVSKVEEAPLVAELTKRGISERKARALVESLPEAQPVRQQLMWADGVIASSRSSFRNPPGFYIHVLQDNIAPPVQPSGPPARRSKPVIETPAREDDHYRLFQAGLIDALIRDELGAERFEEMVTEKARELKRTVGSLKPETIRQVSVATVRAVLLKTVPHVSAAEFDAKRKAA